MLFASATHLISAEDAEIDLSCKSDLFAPWIAPGPARREDAVRGQKVPCKGAEKKEMYLVSGCGECWRPNCVFFFGGIMLHLTIVGCPLGSLDKKKISYHMPRCLTCLMEIGLEIR